MTVVSVIMPTYNTTKWVAATIDSVIAQTYPHVELIVVDDGSQDDTVAVVRQKLANDFRKSWRIIELGANRGPSAARNAGLGVASGDWVQFLDSDDLIPPDKFERQMAFCVDAPADVTAVYSPWRRCYIDGGSITWEGPLIEPDMEGRAPIMCLLGPTRPLHSAGLAKRSALDRIGGFDETLRFWECEEVTHRLAKAGRLAPVPSPEPCYCWRLHREKIYIGGEGARYRSAPVALGWIELILKAVEHRQLDQLGLSDADRRELLDECTLWARLLYVHDRAAFRRYIAMARTLDPRIAPTNPRYVTTAARYVGYEGAEGIARLGRMPRAMVRKTLQRVGLRKPQRNSLFDWN
jgi:glycosyltransferase involved in cell wall biosynthesis